MIKAFFPMRLSSNNKNEAIEILANNRISFVMLI